MHIVLISSFYYPDLFPPTGTFKPYLLELAKNNNVEVICPPSDTHFTTLHEREGIKINYINSLPNRFLSYIKTNRKKNNHPKITRILFNIYRGLRFLKYSVLLESYETSLIKAYFKRLKDIHQNDPIDVIISVSFEFYNHVVGMKFKKQYPSTRWITYTTDPLAYSETNPIARRKIQAARKIEQEVYTTCDFCITTEELYKNIVEDFKIPTTKVHKIPFLLSNSQISSTQHNNEHPFALYAGYLYYKIRNPKILIESFAKIANIELHLYVYGDRFCRKLLEQTNYHNIKINNLVAHDSYIKLLSEADYLVNMCNKVRLQAPSKLTELISTGKPVINFYFYQDSGYRMVEKYPLGINIHYNTEIDTIVDKISDFISAHKNSRISFEEVRLMFPEHCFSSQYPVVRDIILGKKIE